MKNLILGCNSLRTLLAGCTLAISALASGTTVARSSYTQEDDNIFIYLFFLSIFLFFLNGMLLTLIASL